ncbi:NACHT domain-containing protein, partial [Streptomyces hyaluromycini]|uniref:NACHT domain-containing protein n=1 Tax=Streptomyces hyaluromycini TaxID=1377993 RepID=UPI0011AEA2BC
MTARDLVKGVWASFTNAPRRHQDAPPPRGRVGYSWPRLVLASFLGVRLPERTLPPPSSADGPATPAEISATEGSATGPNTSNISGPAPRSPEPPAKPHQERKRANFRDIPPHATPSLRPDHRQNPPKLASAHEKYPLEAHTEDGTLVVAGVVNEVNEVNINIGSYPQDGLGRNFDGLGQVVDALGGAADELGMAVDELGTAVDELARSVDGLGRTADELAEAIQKRWGGGERRRGLGAPIPMLHVRWTTALDGVTTGDPNLISSDLSPRTLDGRLEDITEIYKTIPSGRLVVLGAVGSGKTVLAMRFVLDLLKNRRPGAPVPEIFSLGSWNPKVETLEHWLSSQLSRVMSGLDRVTADGTTLTEKLVGIGRILPVLDGFDEIAQDLQGAAWMELSRTALPWVLTSRTDVYRRAMADTGGLQHAAVIELAPLTPDEAVEYLRLRSSRHDAPAWNLVQAEIQGNPEGPLGLALSTPLMVDLAAIVHGEQGTSGVDEAARGPKRLLTATRFDTREAIEDDLLGAFLPVVYRDRPEKDRAQAQRWLGYLADHLHRIGTRDDLAWWELGASMSLRARTAVISFLSGLFFALASAIGSTLVDLIATSHGLGFAIQHGLVVGLLHGLVTGLAFGLLYRRIAYNYLLRPFPVGVRLFGRSRQHGGRLAQKVVIGSLVGFVVALVIVLVDRLVAPSLGLDDGLKVGLLSAIVFPLVVGLGAGLAGGLMAWLETPIDVMSAVSYTDLLRANRAYVISSLSIWALTLGLVAGLASSFTETPLRSIQLGVAFAVEGGFGAGIGYGLCLTAWGQWVAFARIWLPLTGRLPWRLITFLEDARQRGVLRKSGAMYQFRHRRLRDHLADTFQAGR